MFTACKYRACVNCGEEVRAPRAGTISKSHRGHVNTALDTECGVWGWEWRKELGERELDTSDYYVED